VQGGILLHSEYNQPARNGMDFICNGLKIKMTKNRMVSMDEKTNQQPKKEEELDRLLPLAPEGD
jgi:hypothetical protein